MSKSTTSHKPTKPYKDYPLYAHATRRWAKKIKGRIHYFGPWDDPDGALQRYLDQRDDLMAGRTPRVKAEGLTIRDLLNRFLTAKKMMVDAGEITPRTFADYHATCQRIATAFGKDRLVDDLAADDFRRLRANIAKVWGPVRLGNEIQRVRSVFKFGFDEGLLAVPIRYGQAFTKPSRRVIRKLRNGNGPRMFEAHEIRAILGAAPLNLRAMVLLGVNCGFGNADCANLPRKALDLKGGWVDYPRPKTGIPRRCPLWPETVAALREVLHHRPKPKDAAHAGLVFITRKRESYAKDTADNPITKAMRALLKELGIQRPYVGFYALRHTFETIGGDARDQVAVDHIMGHARDDMASVYRERISDARLRAVVEHVHAWLFPSRSDCQDGERVGDIAEKS